MTIAACYLSPEGVVFGSDSTTTIATAPVNASDESYHYFDFGQKIFELGDNSHLGIVTWGLGGIQHTSYRTLYAEFADELESNAPTTVAEVVQRWAAKFYSVYDSEVGAAYRAALAVAPLDKDALDEAAQGLSAGFCIGGITPPNRRPAAYEIVFSPTDTTVPVPTPIQMGQAVFRGVPMLVDRILYGIDPRLIEVLLASPLWMGKPEELVALVQPFYLGQPPLLPLRDAIDWIYSCIQATIKGVKYSPLAPICGGPVEIAVVTSDRTFRWVRHKNLDAAVNANINETHGEAR